MMPTGLSRGLPWHARPGVSAACVSLLLSLALFAAGSGANIQAESLRFVGASVHTVSGATLSPGELLIQEGKIVAVGQNVPTNNAQTIDLAGLHLYPGLIALDSVLGLTEIGGARATQDHTEVGEFAPDVESWIAVNPDSELIPVTRANGIAYFQPVPKGGLVAGQSGLVAVEGWTTEQRTVKSPVALHLFWPSMDLDTASRGPSRSRVRSKSLEDQARDRRARLRTIAEFFDEAAAYAKARQAATRGDAPSPPRIPAWEALLPYVRGELPIMVHANEARQIKTAIDWATTNGFKLILAGGRDAWRLAELLATSKIPVVFDHTFTRPDRDTDPYDVHFKAPEVLHQAGVLFAFGVGPDTFEAPMSRNLPYAAAQAVAFGLPESEALKALTLYPAQFVGLGGRLGSLEPGKEATFFAADGSILDLRVNVKRMWIAGKEISLENRHTRLYDKYRNRPR